jgi:hypothetical protein
MTAIVDKTKELNALQVGEITFFVVRVLNVINRKNLLNIAFQACWSLTPLATNPSRIFALAAHHYVMH